MDIKLNGKSRLITLAATLGASFAPAAHATAIYSTLGPGGTFDTNAFVQVSSSTPGYADEFTSPVTATVGSVSLPLGAAIPGATPTVSINLWSLLPLPGSPGHIVGNFTPGVVSDAGMVTFASTTGVPLQAGKTYWLSVTPFGSNEGFLWYLNNQGIDNVTASRQPDASFYTLNGSITAPAFELDALPEPGSAALYAMTLVAACLWRKRIL